MQPNQLGLSFFSSGYLLIFCLLMLVGLPVLFLGLILVHHCLNLDKNAVSKSLTRNMGLGFRCVGFHWL